MQKIVYRKKNTISFREYNPNAALLWIEEMNNGMTPDNTASQSSKSVYLRCPNNSSHVYSKPVHNISLKSPYGCPICKKPFEKPIMNLDNLFLNYPIAKEMWDFDKNKDIDYTTKLTTNDKVWWKCKKGHTFNHSILYFIRNQRCLACEKKYDYIVNYPHLMKQWNFEKNSKYDVNTKLACSQDKAWWICHKCGYEWESQIASRKASKGLCLCCENRTVVVEGITDLFTLVPELKEEYLEEENKHIVPTSLSVTSGTPIVWKCSKCQYVWKTAPSTRVYKKNEKYYIRSCPVCSGIKRLLTYAEEYPELDKMFEFELNGCHLSTLTTSDVNKKFFWRCSVCEEAFTSKLDSMIRSLKSKYRGCPYCAGRKFTSKRSFGALHPDLLLEYDSTNDIDPYQVAEMSKEKVKWICTNNKEHKWEASFLLRAKGYGKCPICKNYNYSKKFIDEHPEFEQYYDIQKNVREFSSYSFSSNEKVWWRCDLGHEFEYSFMSFHAMGHFECPICENRLLVPGINDLESQYPKLAKEFNVERNGILPNQILINNGNKEFWWKCERGHEFKRLVNYRVFKNSKCPICINYQVKKGDNDFQSKYPEIVSIWDYDKNKKSPDKISYLSKDCFYFKCSEGHSYYSHIETVIRNNFNCLVCSGKKVVAGVNSVSDTHPKLAAEWSPNNKKGPESYSKTHKVRIKWICKRCNGEYEFPINERENDDNACPYCRDKRTLLGRNSLTDTHPILIKEWSSDNIYGPENYMKGSNFRAIWECSVCGGKFKRGINEREEGDDACPYCNRGKALLGVNSLVDTHESLTAEWSPSNEKGPDKYTKESSYRALWICPTCDGEYAYEIGKREVGDEACPYCNRGKVLLGVNSLVDTHKSLVAEWSPSNEKGADRYTKGSSYRALWICAICKGEYVYPIREREVGDDACPYCNNRKVKPGYNSFKVKHQDLMKEWDYINNYLLVDPDNILGSYNSNVWWKCDACGYHYEMSPQRRIYYQNRHRKSCPYCKGFRRKKRYYLY